MRTYAKFRWEQGNDKVYRPIGTCTVCGKEFKSGNIFASCYCPECAARIKKEKTRERVRKHRLKQKTST